MNRIRYLIGGVMFVFLTLFIIALPLVKPIPVKPSRNPVNVFEMRIDSLIDLVSSDYINRTYNRKLTKYYIEDYSKQNLFDNSSRTEHKLRSELNHAYAKSLLKMAEHRFTESSTDWFHLVLLEIELEEVFDLGTTNFSDLTNKELKEINNAINIYDQFETIIDEYRDYNYPYYGINSKFPISEINNVLLDLSSLKSRRNRNKYARNGYGFDDIIKQLKIRFYNAHLDFLENQILQNVNRFKEYRSYEAYLSNINNPLISNINQMYNSSYQIDATVFSDNKSILENWVREIKNNTAYNYFKTKTPSYNSRPNRNIASSNASSRSFRSYYSYTKSNGFIRSSASAISSVIKKVDSNSRLQVIGKEGNYLYVKYHGTSGYIHKMYVK